jgi:hypothetical protein
MAGTGVCAMKKTAYFVRYENRTGFVHTKKFKSEKERQAHIEDKADYDPHWNYHFKTWEE